jgi:hypothetical protein
MCVCISISVQKTHINRYVKHNDMH